MDSQKNNLDSPIEYYIQSVHDHMFRESMQYLEIAHDIVKIILPSSIVHHVELDSLELVKGDTIDDHLDERRSDIVYRAKLLKTDQWVYLLFEHKSDKDKKIHKKLLCYMIEIWDQLEQQNPSIEQFPVVISIVVYHGNTPWEIANSSKPLFAIIEEIEAFVPDFRSLILDLSKFDPEMIADSKLKMLLLALKYSRKPSILRILPQIIRMPGNFKGEGKDEYLKVVLVYLGSVLKGNNLKEFWRIIVREHKDGEVYMETIADVLRKEERLKREKIEKTLHEEIDRKEKEIKLIKEEKTRELEQKDSELERKDTELKKKDTELVRRMLKKDMSVRTIQEITGLSDEKIEQIRKNI